jgi:hypothetical protein
MNGYPVKETASPEAIQTVATQGVPLTYNH